MRFTSELDASPPSTGSGRGGLALVQPEPVRAHEAVPAEPAAPPAAADGAVGLGLRPTHDAGQGAAHSRKQQEGIQVIVFYELSKLSPAYLLKRFSVSHPLSCTVNLELG